MRSDWLPLLIDRKKMSLLYMVLIYIADKEVCVGEGGGREAKHKRNKILLPLQILEIKTLLPPCFHFLVCRCAEVH